jgi:CheY-like chemotaxis protein
MPNHILIVDDDVANIDLFKVMFRTLNVEVQSATTGGEALEQAQSDPPLLLFLDLMLPDMTGFEVCARLKGDPATARIQIAMLTGRSDEAARQKAQEVGADHFLVKPVTRADLKALLDSALGA